MRKGPYFILAFLIGAVFPARGTAATLHLGSASGCQGDSVFISVDVVGASSIEAFGLDVAFDPAKVGVERILPGSSVSSWSLVSGSVVEAGVLRIGGFAGTASPVSGDVELARIEFRLTAAPPDSMVLSASNARDGISAALFADGALTIVGTCPTPTATLTATPPATPSWTHSPSATPTSSPTPVLRIGEASGCEGDRVEVSIGVSLGNELTAFGFNLTFDPSRVDFLGVVSGAATGRWALIDGTPATTETIRIGGFAGAEPAIYGGAELVRAIFRIVAAGGSTVPLTADRLTDGLAGGVVLPGEIAILTVCPTPTASATPTATPPPSATATPSPSVTATPIPQVLIEQVSACPDEWVTVSVDVSGVTDLETYGIEIAFDPVKIAYASAKPGIATSGWATVSASPLAAGVVRLGGFAGGGPALSGSGQIAELEFLVRSAGPDTVAIGADRLFDALTGATVIEGAIQIRVCQSATPTPSPTGAQSQDSDGDGYSDEYEIRKGTAPDSADDHPDLGDLDGDGRATTLDALVLYRSVLAAPPPPYTAKADINEDGAVNTTDAVLLYNWAIGLDGYRVIP